MDITKQLLANARYQELIKLNSEYDEAHNLDHFIRVKRYALLIGKDEGADLEILVAAAMLHDIARGLETIGKSTDHLITGAEISKAILEQIGFPENKIDAVCYCVSVHQRRTGIEPKTIESKVIQDADLLDTYGLVYAARSFVWGVQSEKYKRPIFVDADLDMISEHNKNNSTIHYLLYRLQDPKYDPSTLHTVYARNLAKKQIGDLKSFVEKFMSEYRGEVND